MTDTTETDEETNGEPRRYTVSVSDETTVIADSREEALAEARNTYGAAIPSNNITVVDSEPVAQLTGPKARVRFQAQRWVDDYARNVEPKGKDTWWVPFDDVLDDDGQLLDDDTMDTDQLKWHDRAPLWVQNWDGPFYVEINDVVDLPDGESIEDYLP